ncbi:glycine betaine ABC transporter substrate-binding protein [Alkalihalobacillus sp. BA299]|uniref:glycine betaine ABC transporter substrate-binding protein n=1 Tax=Alkalihalobacillus sp. BA299 TaxID=2815938 RepID=UPI001ADD2488|nr:glycine betaine ABC transporter substrate-binding protein [Alkalihalobacillus sp. BA299]
MEKKLYLILIVCLLFALGGCNWAGTQQEQDQESFEKKGKLVIGGKDFTEQSILLLLTSIYLNENGYEVEVINRMKSNDLREALINGQIDFYWEYTGTALMLFLNEKGESDPDQAYRKVKELDELNHIEWLNKTDFNNTYAILMTNELSKELGVQTISDLAKYINNGSRINFASETEFYDRDDGLKGLQSFYKFEIPRSDVLTMDSGLTYNALREGQAEIIVGFETDGSNQELELFKLEDDQSFFPAYNAAPVVRKDVLAAHKDLAYLLNHIADRLDTETMMKLNYSVDIEQKNILEVCRTWLKGEGLIH